MSKPSRRASRAADRQLGGPGSAGGPTPSARQAGQRAGRRERQRPSLSRRSFLDRYRGPIFGVVGLAAIIVIGAFVFYGATAKTYACSNLWEPAPTASPAAGATPALGYVQPDQGRSHTVNQPQRYTSCPPASGNHYNVSGRGPISPRLYGPDDYTEPQGWIHNLEHGALVVLYRCDGDACTDAGQARLRAFYQTFPNSPVCNIPAGQIGPVIARFDEMKWPYAALIWDRVLPLESFDAAQIRQFWQEFGERTNPEPQAACSLVSPSPEPSASTLPSGSPAASGSPVASGSAAAPATSPEPSPSAS